MDEDPAVAFEFLQHESLTAEQAGQDFLTEGGAQRHTLGRSEKTVLLADQPAADVTEVDRQDGSGKRRGEADMGFAGTIVREDRREEPFARDQTLAGTHQLAEETAFLLGTVTEHRRHLDQRVLVHHGASLRDGALSGVELNFNVLRPLTFGLEINHV